MKFRYYQEDDRYAKFKEEERQTEEWGFALMWLYIVIIYLSFVGIGIFIGHLLYKYL